MSRPHLAFLLCALLLPSAATAQIAAPGLGLDRPDVDDVFLTGLAAGPPAFYIGVAIPGYYAYVDGPQVLQIFQGGVMANGAGAGAALTFPIATSLQTQNVLTNTLLPPFATGALAGFDGSTVLVVSAFIFEPDQVKRSQSSKGGRVKLKQKDSVGFRVGRFGVGTYLLYSTASTDFFNPGPVQGCKGAADIRATDPPRVKMQVSCRGAAGKVLKESIARELGLRGGFKLNGEFQSPP